MRTIQGLEHDETTLPGASTGGGGSGTAASPVPATAASNGALVPALSAGRALPAAGVASAMPAEQHAQGGRMREAQQSLMGGKARFR